MDIYEQVEELEDFSKLLFESLTLSQADNADLSHIKRLSYIIFEKTKDLKNTVLSR